MPTTDNNVTIVPYFRINEGMIDAFKAITEQMVERTSSEEACLYYGFSFSGDVAHCREGYRGGSGALAHLENIGPLLEEALKISELFKLEIHGKAEEIEALREPMAELSAEFFILEHGFRR